MKDFGTILNGQCILGAKLDESRQPNLGFLSLSRSLPRLPHPHPLQFYLALKKLGSPWVAVQSRHGNREDIRLLFQDL